MPNETSIVKAFSSVEDPRIDRTKKHKLIDIITISLCAMVGGAEGWEDIEFFGNERLEWFQSFLELPNGIPSHDTIRRVFERIDTKQFNACLVEWTKTLHQSTKGMIVAIDGKSLRHSFDNATGKSALHLVSAWVHDSNIMIGQCAVDTKKNEISSIPKMLDMIEISGAIVTIDAIGCQKEFARAIIEDKNADYVLAVKANQPNLLSEIQEMF
jgi:predicted transposase YbfD/YdcC